MTFTSNGRQFGDNQRVTLISCNCVQHHSGSELMCSSTSEHEFMRLLQGGSLGTPDSIFIHSKHLQLGPQGEPLCLAVPCITAQAGLSPIAGEEQLA